MNLQNIIAEIETVDPEIYERTSTRRDTFKHFTGKRIALAALPFALGGVFKKAYGQTTTDIIGVLNFALTLEYLEYHFYLRGVATAGLVPVGTPAVGAFTLIRDHENSHVNFLRTTITSLGGTPVLFTAAQFDFTAQGTFPTVFSNYDTFLAVAQTFEDTGVRAYKGQAPNLISNNDVLTAALQIHSVEGRHAAHIRYMRRAKVRQLRAERGAAVKPWITLNQSGIASPAVQPSYNGEELTTQAGTIVITNINGQSISASAASESFDEPLTKAQVQAIVAPFFV